MRCIVWHWQLQEARVPGFSHMGNTGSYFYTMGHIRGRIWHAMPHWLNITAGTLFLLMLAVFLFTEGCIISGFSKNTDKELDYIVVLGAQLKTTGPSRVLQYRLDTAYEYLTAHPDTKVIVSGGQGSNEPASEAQGMCDYLVKRGIEPDRIILEDKSVNTEQNIRFSKVFCRQIRTRWALYPITFMYSVP